MEKTLAISRVVFSFISAFLSIYFFWFDQSDYIAHVLIICMIIANSK